MGDSLNSNAGNGAVITRVPDSPINLSNNVPISNAERIGFLWDNGIENGGQPIIDYRVWYDLGIDEWEILDYGITDTQYVTSVPLVAGTVYVFTVQSRNSVGFSD